MDLYLVAFLLPPAASQAVWALKQEVHQLTGSRNAIRLPPHLTLLPPLRRPPGFGAELRQLLAAFAAETPACPVALRDFAWFQDRTLYVRVGLAAGLQQVHQQFYQRCARELPTVPPPTRPFVPHVTLATRDLPPDQIPALRALFSSRTFAADSVLDELVLFRHTGQQWEAEARFTLPAAPAK
jgi:2'-5' RNA ligase